MSGPALVEVRGGGERRDLVLPPGEAGVGRAPDNAVVLDDPLVSRHHLRLSWDGAELRVTDLGSSNGTRVGDVELEPRVPRTLLPGETVRIGGCSLAVVPPPGLDVTLRPPPAGARAAAPPDASADAGGTTIVLASAPRLVVTTPAGTVEHPLDRDVLTVGRDPTSDIVVDHPAVSRRHATVRRVGDGWEIEDAGSANGLVRRGSRVARAPLTDGDTLHVLDAVTLTFRAAPGLPPAQEGARTLPLAGRESLTIGRGAGNDVDVPHPTVSRAHARVLVRDGATFVEDLGSANGTFVDGERLPPGEPRRVEPGSEIRVGPARFVVAAGALEQSDESRDLQLDAVHLNQPVSKGLNLLQDISLSIRPREFVALVGVSGAGKSTLLDALNGFRPARDGSVLVNGTDLYRNAEAFRTSIGYVPQDDIIHRELTVRQALDYSARLRLPSDTTADERRRRVDDVLETLGLVERANVPIHRLSGGQRKRVSIGVELLTEPGLFFLDEATSGLDPGTEGQLMRLLRTLADRGHTVILVTHATKNVMLCDQVAFLAKGGHVAYFGPPDQALDYFGVTDFDGIYDMVERESTPEEWDARFRASPQFREFVVGRLQARYGDLVDVPRPGRAGRPGGAAAGARRRTRPSMLRQFRVLSARYLSIIRRDRVNLLLLFLVAPLLACIDFIAWPRDVFDPLTGDATRAMSMLFMASIIPFLVGALSSVREIVKEAPIHRRERAVAVGVAPYLASKVWVGVLFALYNAAVLLAIKIVAVDMGHLGPQAVLLVFVTLTLAAISGVMWGLLISAIAPREEQAMLLVIVVVVVQIVFSGGLVPLDRLGTVGGAIADATSTKWVFQGLTTATEVRSGDCTTPTLDACRLPGIESYATPAERQVMVGSLDEAFGPIFGTSIAAAWAATGLIALVLYVVVYLLLRRKGAR
jgi:ABC-type multidrug transport system ATPase subunit/pSer/pThr/pTyr-binding forkhead associated (FHA) protein